MWIFLFSAFAIDVPRLVQPSCLFGLDPHSKISSVSSRGGYSIQASDFTLWHWLKLRSRVVIVEVNGHPLKGPDELYEAYKATKSASECIYKTDRDVVYTVNLVGSAKPSTPRESLLVALADPYQTQSTSLKVAKWAKEEPQEFTEVGWQARLFHLLTTEESSATFATAQGELKLQVSGPALSIPPLAAAALFTKDGTLRREVLTDYDGLRRAGRVIPHKEAGKQDGFRLSAIRRGSVGALIGLKNGDIITHINGIALTRTDLYDSIQTALSTATTLSIEGLRRKKVFSLSIPLEESK